ncbi:helix-turn-helix transcriptional regulator [Sphingobacterium pedocola]|uniref:AraC family transcriptional regulator n=1 Tax=Sphingobacterium pedocola TaxID=2082722 RepID=A0ABR9TBK4_9SPHI|nr:AraC family transcriptional regulator [Sphingobacterium pedocola]MBE8722676.1 AraC family transcriptional regulator [Sphingobacterium pedocola]
MGIQLVADDLNDFMSVEELPGSSLDEIRASRFNLKLPKGDITFDEYVLRKEMSIVNANYAMQEDVNINGRGDNALLEIQINLSDKDIFYTGKANKGQTTAAKSANIKFLSADENQANILFQKDTAYQTFDIHLPVTLLDRYAGESRLMDDFIESIHRGISTSLVPHQLRICPNIYHIIQDIKNCTFDGLTRKIYLESKAFELIALLYEQSENKSEYIPLSVADQQKIHLAADTIRTNLERPLTILELSRFVGINQTKLKNGFKLVYGNTIFEYLQDIRMHQAKKYLLDTTLSVQEIALLVGYQNTSNFSAAFKKTQGYSPMKLREKQGA